MEIVTFSHFSDVMSGHSFHDVINHNAGLSERYGCQAQAAVFIDPRSLALGAEYEVLQFLVVERTLLTLCSTV